MTLQLGDVFPDITTAKLSIKAFVADNGETSRTVKSDKTRVLLACKSNSCGFRIRAINSKKKGVSITHLEPHSCNPATHYIAPNTNALQFLIPHHRAAIPYKLAYSTPLCGPCGTNTFS
jgi:hypothetical protein